MDSPLDILGRYWGYDSFRECQAEIIDSVLSGHDTIGLLPTGGGKSITFQVPAMLLPGVTVVVTPLISLMKDQVDNLCAVGIPATCVHSGMSRPERHVALDRIRLGRAKIAYFSPEKLTTTDFATEIRNWDVSLLVVDEAHCISQWGYDFRPPYLRIAELRALLPGVPALALTASATPKVVHDIADKLAMREPAIFSRSFSRDNISYIVRRTDNKEDELIHILSNTSGSAIVYVRSRERTGRLAAMIDSCGITADFYHAGLDAHIKTERQDRWKRGDVRVMVATNAFGMGIDKPDVRLVVHYDLPPSLEEYYQEAGRAGRDGLTSYAVTLANSRDKALLTRRLGEEFPGKEYIRTVYDKLATYLNVSVGCGYMQVYECDVEKMCHIFDLQVRPTLSALRILTRSGAIEYGEDTDARARVMITVTKRELYQIDLTEDADSVLRELLRSYTGIFADFVRIDEEMVAMRTHLTTEQVYQSLLMMRRMHVLQYVPRRMVPYVLYPTAREEGRHVIIPRAVYEDRLRQATARMEAMRDYVFDDSSCRVQRMLRYFGQIDAAPCGKCDVCRGRRLAARSDDYTTRVLHILGANPSGLAPADLRRYFPGTDFSRAMACLRSLVDDGTVELRDDRFHKA